MTPSREPSLRLTPKGQAVVDALTNAKPGPVTHGLYDIVAMATCHCGATFDGNGSSDHALAQLDAHIAAIEAPILVNGEPFVPGEGKERT